MRTPFTQVCLALELCFTPGLLGLFVQKQRVLCPESEFPCEPSKTCFACTTGRDTAYAAHGASVIDGSVEVDETCVGGKHRNMHASESKK